SGKEIFGPAPSSDSLLIRNLQTAYLDRVLGPSPMGRLGRKLLVILLGLAGVVLPGCRSRVVDSGKVETPVVQPRTRAADFVLLVDNSRSISAAEQALVREVTMVLADLAAADH